jgi:hypothetical protein
VRIRNINPTGDVWNVHTGFLAAGEEIDVPDEIGAALLEQVGNFEAVTKTSKPAKTED